MRPFQMTRHFLLAFALATGAALAADPVLINLVAPDSKVIAGMNVDQAKGSLLGQMFLAQMNAEPEFQKMVTQTGFEPSRDLHEILAAGTFSQANQGVVFARATLDKVRILT